MSDSSRLRTIRGLSDHDLLLYEIFGSGSRTLDVVCEGTGSHGHRTAKIAHVRFWAGTEELTGSEPCIGDETKVDARVTNDVVAVDDHGRVVEDWSQRHLHFVRTLSCPKCPQRVCVDERNYQAALKEAIKDGASTVTLVEFRCIVNTVTERSRR